MTYDLKPVSAPRAAGRRLRAFVALVENPATGSLLAERLLRDAGIIKLRQISAGTCPASSLPVFDHGQARAKQQSEPVAISLPQDTLPRLGFYPETSHAFITRYKTSECDPVAMAERALEIWRDSDNQKPAMRVLIAQKRDDFMTQAEASAERYRKGQSRGPLDGVPVVIKDEFDQRGYPTTVGTRFLGRRAATEDAEIVARLRRAGALLIGKGNMHEIGMGVTGLNPHHGAARNPFDTARATGGSSSGPAAAVAMGLCPLAVGADGGGSIRIPAALCGQFGLKATFGRISEYGVAELCWSVAHAGPIASSLYDLALGYRIMAGPDPKDPNSLLQPEPQHDSLLDGDVSGLRIGIYQSYFDDADQAIVEQCQRAVTHLEKAGATIVPIRIDGLEAARIAHIVTIIAEMSAAHIHHYAEHRKDYALDTRLNLSLGRRLQGYDYVHAQRHRQKIWNEMARVFGEVDVVATPSTACTAPLLPEDALATGESNLSVTSRIMRFAPIANLTGLPAMTVPVGYDDDGLPIGLQLLGRAWHEHVLFRCAAALEGSYQRESPSTQWHYFDKAEPQATALHSGAGSAKPRHGAAPRGKQRHDAT